MAKKNDVVNANDITGSNVYHIKNQTLYLNPLDKQAYIITNSNAKRFTQWQLRLPLSLLVSCILILFKIDYFVSLAIGLIIFVLATYVFQTRFISHLSVQSNFTKPKSEGIVKETKKKLGKGRLQLLSILFLALSILMVINLIISKYTGTALIINIVYIVIPIIVAIVTFILSIKA